MVIVPSLNHHSLLTIIAVVVYTDLLGFSEGIHTNIYQLLADDVWLVGVQVSVLPLS